MPSQSALPGIASALIPPTTWPGNILAGDAAMPVKILAAFWNDLRSEGLVHAISSLPAHWRRSMGRARGGLVDNVRAAIVPQPVKRILSNSV